MKFKIRHHNKINKKIPKIPKEYFTRKHIPPPFNFHGAKENRKHYAYKILLGETIRDNLPFLDRIDYEWTGLPSFYNERHNKFINYQPDVFVTWHDKQNKISYFSDIEINGLIHYKSKEQILKVKERLNLVYPLLTKLKEVEKEDYKTIGSYIIIDKDDFEYNDISTIFADVRTEILSGGLYPKDILQILDFQIKVAK